MKNYYLIIVVGLLVLGGITFKAFGAAQTPTAETQKEPDLTVIRNQDTASPLIEESRVTAGSTNTTTTNLTNTNLIVSRPIFRTPTTYCEEGYINGIWKYSDRFDMNHCASMNDLGRNIYTCVEGNSIPPNPCPAGSELSGPNWTNVAAQYACIKSSPFTRQEIQCVEGFNLRGGEDYIAKSTGSTPNYDNNTWIFNCIGTNPAYLTACPQGTNIDEWGLHGYECYSYSPFTFSGCITGYEIGYDGDHSQTTYVTYPALKYYVSCVKPPPATCGNSGAQLVGYGGDGYCCKPQ